MATKTDIEGVKQDIEALRLATKADIESVKKDFKADMAELEARLTWRMLSCTGLTIAAIGVLLALFK